MPAAPERVRSGVGFALASQLVGAALTAGLTIYLARTLTQQQYGYFAFAVGLSTVATLLSDFGVSAAAGRFMAERQDAAAAAAVLRTALRIKLGLGVGTAAALIAFAGPICTALGSAGAVSAVRWVAVALVGQSLFLLLFAAFEAMGRLQLRLVAATFESVTEVSASITLVALGAGAAGAGLGRAVGYVAGGAIGLLLVRRAFEGHGASGPAPRFSARKLMGYAAPLLLVDAAFRVFSSIDLLLISAILGGGVQVAAFELPMRLAAFLDYPAAALASAVAPRLANREGGADVAVFVRAMRVALLLQCATIPALLVWPEAIVGLLVGDRFPQASGVLRALAPFVLFAGVAQLVTLGTNYLGLAWRRVPLAVAMLAVNVAVDLILLPRIGVVAGAIGTGAAYAIWVPAHVWLLRRHAGLPLSALAVTLLRCLLAGTAMAAVLAAFGTGRLGAGYMVLGGAAGLAAYVVALVALRELDRQELAAAFGALRTRLRGQSTEA